MPPAHPAASVRIAHTLFRATLRVLPASARRAIGADAARLFERLAADAHGRRGALAVAVVLLRSIVDVLVHALRERREPMVPFHSRNRPPRLRIELMASLLSDLRHALRGLLASPLYTAVVLATLALGIGANTAIFSLVNGVLITPLGYPEPERLVVFWGTDQGVPKDSGTIAYLNFIDVRERSSTFAAAAAYDEWRATLTGTGEPEQLEAAAVNVEFFDVLGVTPAAGRFFLAEEDEDGKDRVVVLSHGLWTRRFGRDPQVVGSTLILNGNPHAVVGVAPANFEDPMLSGAGDAPPELWRPLGYYGVPVESMPSRGSSSYTAIGRLADGATVEAAQGEVQATMAALEEQYPGNNAGQGMTLVPLRDTIVGPARSSLLLLSIAVGVVLTIAVANVAGLMVARATDRGRETALRLALGAGRARLLQLFLAESLLLATLGGLLGIATAHLLVRLLLGLGGDTLPRAAAVGLDLPVLAFTAAVSLATGLACGLAPLRGAFRSDLQVTLRGAGTAAVAGGTAGRRLLVGAEVALAVVLLVGALLMLRSFVALAGVDTGLESDRVLAFDVSLPYSAYPEHHEHTAFFTGYLERLETLPGVRDAATVNILPLIGGFDCNGTWAAERPEPPPNQGPCPEVRTVSIGYLETLGIDLLRGRWFTPDDRADSEWVTVINDVFARELWGDEDPLGRAVINYREQPITVVGVVRSIKHRTLDEQPTPAMYLVHGQGIMEWQTSSASIVLRADGDPRELVEPARAALRAMDPQLPISAVRTFSDVLADNVAAPRFRALLIGSFAATALLLAALGVYGVVSYTVSSQLREVAIQLALGAESGRVVRDVLRTGLMPVIAGLVVGLLGAALGSGAIRNLLFEVRPLDPLVFAVVPVLLLAVAVVACWLPARRALRVDPMSLLRQE